MNRLRPWAVVVLFLTCVDLSGCGRDDSSSSTSPSIPRDTRPPSVLWTEPPSNGVVSTDVVIRVGFSEPLDAATVSSETFVIFGPDGEVTGVVAAAGSIAMFTPSTPLQDGANYMATLTAGIADLSGNPLGDEYSWKFRTLAYVPTFLYAAEYLQDQVWAFAVDAQTGALSKVPSAPFWAGEGTNGLAIEPAGRFLYASNESYFGIAGFSIDSSSGALTRVPGESFEAGDRPSSIVAAPGGRFVYVANGGGDISGYSIDSSSGDLVPLPGSPFARDGYGPSSIACDGSGRFLYVTNWSNSTVSGFRIDPTTGSLTPVPGSPYSGFYVPSSIAVHPNGSILYVANQSRWIFGFSINSETGALTPLAGSPFFVPGDGERRLSSVALRPGGRHLYVSTYLSTPEILGYSIDESGALTPLPDFSVPTGTLPKSIHIEGSGRFAYVAHYGGISAFSIDDASGRLTQIEGSPFGGSEFPYAIATAGAYR